MMNRIVFTLSLLQMAQCFHVAVEQRSFVTRLASTKEGVGNKHIEYNPFEGSKSVDMERARDCAEHFGKCSVSEMKDLKQRLHEERLQRFLFEPKVSPVDDVAVEHRVLEEELELQLEMLEEHEARGATNSNLFPEVEEPMVQLPHLKDHTLAHDVEEVVHKAEQVAALGETIFEESVLETFAMCLVVASLIFLPQVIHV